MTPKSECLHLGRNEELNLDKTILKGAVDGSNTLPITFLFPSTKFPSNKFPSNKFPSLSACLNDHESGSTRTPSGCFTVVIRGKNSVTGVFSLIGH